MATSNALRLAFLLSPENFLRDYIVDVNGSMNAQNASKNNILLNLMPNGGAAGPWNIAAAATYTDLNAPPFFAYFDDARLNATNPMIPFDIPRIIVDFDTAPIVNGVAGVPVSLIPYAYGCSYGAQLPVDPNPGAPTVAYAMTTTMDGCTLQLSGSTEAPFMSHTNVADIAAPDFMQRQAVMTQRLLGTLNAFGVAIGVAGLPVPGANNINNQNYNSLNYGFWTRHYPQAPGYSINYLDNGQTAITTQLALQGGKTWRGAVNPGMLWTDQYWLHLLQTNFDDIYEPVLIPRVIVFGVRANAEWRLYYQESLRLQFNITRESIYPGGITTKTLIMAGGAPQVFTAFTVVNRGQLWPYPNRRMFQV